MRKLILLSLILVSSFAFCQDQKKLDKYLKVTIVEPIPKSAAIAFDRKNPEKHGFDDIEEAFRNSFINNGFTINNKPKYKIVMDYDYGYVIAQYRFQYKNLNAEIVDTSNDNKVVASIVYIGRFELENIADAIAEKLTE